MNFEIVPCDILHNKKDRKAFIDLPWKLYKNDPTWVPPLKLSLQELFSPKHPFYENAEIRAWLAKKDGEVVGRILAGVNQAHNEFHQEKSGFFGFFECHQNPQISQALMKVAEDYVKEKGMDNIRGPLNPSTNYECGLLVEGPKQDAPQIMMTYNPSYYQNFIENQGYQKAKDLLAYQISFDNFSMPEKITQVVRKVESSQRLTYRHMKKKNWDHEIQKMMEIYNSAWERNWGFVPMSPKEFFHTAKDLKMVVDEKLVLFAMANGEEVGFIVALPDYNQVFKRIPSGKLLPTGILKLMRADKYIDRFRVITLGLKREYRNTGLASLLYNKVYETVRETSKYKEVEMSWVLEDNLQMNKPLVLMGANPYKRYRIFEKTLS